MRLFRQLLRDGCPRYLLLYVMLSVKIKRAPSPVPRMTMKKMTMIVAAQRSVDVFTQYSFVPLQETSRSNNRARVLDLHPLKMAMQT